MLVHKVALEHALVDAEEVVVVTAREIAPEHAGEDAVMVALEAAQGEICLFHIKIGKWS